MTLVYVLLAAVAWVIGASVRKVNATVTIPQDEVTFTSSASGMSVRAGSSYGPQIPTDGNTLPGSPEYGPDLPGTMQYYINHNIPGEGSASDGS